MNGPRTQVESAASTAPQQRSGRSSGQLRPWWLCVICLVCLVTVGGVVILWVNSRLRAGQESLLKADFAAARQEISRYLRFFPNDPVARLAMAEALTLDDSLTDSGSLEEAVAHLQRARQSPQHSARALLEEARVRFLLLQQPYYAEPLLRAAAGQKPDSFDSSYLLWKLLDMTLRAESAEPLFWRCFELAEPARKPLLLREWYLSQFSPRNATAELDHRMGVLEPNETPTELTEMRRLRRFQERCPDVPTAHWAIVRLLLQSGNLPLAQEAMRNMPESIRANDEPFCLATRLAVLFELGQFHDLEALLQQWHPPHDGYDYWKWQGMIQDEVQGDASHALQSYQKALQNWPGHIDWKLRFRCEKLLLRLRQTEAAADAHRAGERVAAQMQIDVHSRLRKLLGNLRDRKALQAVAEFYEQIERPREARHWREYLLDLPD